ncbi:MAG: hypothetical protein FWD26_03530 [Treponema sp.]|nr:hypothetical protein [Treponema sp.]
MNTDIKGADFLDTMLLRNNISLNSIAKYSSKNNDELMNMENIFNLKSKDDFSCCLTIPFLLDPHAAQDIIAYFKNEEQDNPYVKSSLPDVEKYKLLLASAFVFNPSFFAMSWNWCALIRHELQLQMLKGQKENKTVQIGLQRRFPASRPAGILKVKNPRYRMQAASGTESIQEIGDWKVDDKNDLYGHLWIKITNGEVRFLFKFETYCESPPCYITVKCKTKDGREYSNIILKEIELNNPEKEELIIRSEIIAGFDCSDVEILELECKAND